MNHETCLSLLEQAAGEATRDEYRAQIEELKEHIRQREGMYGNLNDWNERDGVKAADAMKAHYDSILLSGWSPVAGGQGGYRPVRKLRHKITLEEVYVSPADAREYLTHETDGPNWQDITD